MPTLRDKIVTDYLDIQCEIDNIPFEHIVSLTYNHTVDAARIVKMRVGGLEPTTTTCR